VVSSEDRGAAGFHCRGAKPGKKKASKKGSSKVRCGGETEKKQLIFQFSGRGYLAVGLAKGRVED